MKEPAHPFIRDPRPIPPPQMVPGSEIFYENGADNGYEPDTLYRAEDRGDVAGVADWLDATQGAMAGGDTEIDSRIHPNEQSSGPLPGQEGVKKLSVEVRTAAEALRHLREVISHIDDAEMTGARRHIVDKDPDLHLLKAILEIAVLRNTVGDAADWQSRMEKLAKTRMNSLATAKALAVKHLLDFRYVGSAVVQLCTFVEKYAAAYFPNDAKRQHEEAVTVSQARKDRFTKLGKVDLKE